MEYTPEDIYLLVGKEDKVAGLTFKYGTDSFKEYGSFISVVFIYTQKERQQLDEKIKIKPYIGGGFLKAEYLGLDLSIDKIEKLRNTGVNCEDIIDILNYLFPTKNSFHSKETRSIDKMEIKLNTMPKGQDYDWMYGFKRKLVKENIGLCPEERNFYLAGKYYYEYDELTADELVEMTEKEGLLKEDVEIELLLIKYIREEISDEEKEIYAKLVDKKITARIEILNKYLEEIGSSFKKLATTNINQAFKMFSKVIHFKEHRLNVISKVPIYLDIHSYLHIYLRHVKEMQVNQQFENKDNFQWNEEDVFSVMEKVIEKSDEEIQQYFNDYPGKQYSCYGEKSIYFQGDYYTFHIEPNGRVSTFHKNKKVLSNKN